MNLSEEQLQAFLSGRDSTVRALALASRDLVLDVFPDAIETTEGNELGYGFDRGYKGLVFTISLTRAGVNLGVFGGASLDDPAGILEGTGKVHRHVKIRAESDLDGGLRELLTRALGERRVTPERQPGGEVMAAAGIVTGDSSVFEEIVAGSPTEIRKLALASRALIFDVLPQTVEVVWPRQRTAGYGTGPKKTTEQFCWLAPQTKHVVFGFYYATELPAPESLLEGTGRLMRHAKIRTKADLENPALRRLVEVATTHRVPPVTLR